MVDVALHFRAAQAYAARVGKVGALPTFFTANRAPDPVFGMHLIPAAAAEFRDVAVAELGNPAEADFGARMRAASTYAGRTGFAGAFPTFFSTPPGPDQKHGTVLLRAGVVQWQDVAAPALGNPAAADIGGRIRATDAYGKSIGMDGGFPNFFEAHPGAVTVYGTFFFSPGATQFRDVPASALGGASLADPAGLMRAAQTYAAEHGFVAAMPTFFTALKGGWVCGMVVLDGAAAQWRDVPREQVRGLYDDLGRAMRDAHDVGVRAGFVSGFPTFFVGTGASGDVAGVVLLGADAATWADVPAAQLGNPPETDLPGRFRASNTYAASQHKVGGYPNLYHADRDGERVYGTVTIHHPGATFDDVPAVVLYDDRIVGGAIRQKWVETGDVGGLGLPLTAETGCADNVGRYNLFENGAIVWSPTHGAHAMGTGIHAHWMTRGGENSPYGYPVSDEHDWAPPGEPPGRAVDFEHGTIAFRGGPIDLPETLPPLETSITTPDGTPLGGGARFTMNAAGDYQFDFHMRATGAISYSFALTGFYNSPGAPSLASGRVGGSVAGTFDSGSRGWQTTVGGNSAMIRASWRDLVAAGPDHGRTLTVIKEYDSEGVLGALPDIGSLISDVAAAGVGVAGGVVFWLGSGIGELLPSMGIGETFGIVAGTVVFACGGGLFLALAAGVAVGGMTEAMVKSRGLAGWEADRLNSVFRGTLDTGRLKITNLGGLDNRAFTARGLDGVTYLNLGSDEAFDDPTGHARANHPEPGQLLVHEAVHAWQIQHGFYPEVFCKGIINQVRYLEGKHVYTFGPPGTPWDRFNAEQQASLVDTWFENTGFEASDQSRGHGWPRCMADPMAGAVDPYFPYVHQHLRHP